MNLAENSLGHDGDYGYDRKTAKLHEVTDQLYALVEERYANALITDILKDNDSAIEVAEKGQKPVEDLSAVLLKTNETNGNGDIGRKVRGQVEERYKEISGLVSEIIVALTRAQLSRKLDDLQKWEVHA